MTRNLDTSKLDIALQSLAVRLEENNADAVSIVVCGDAALIQTGILSRTTTNVGIVALMHEGELGSPAPLPPVLLRAATEVAEDLGLDARWLNNGPSSGAGGLFQMGLPDGFSERLLRKDYGPRLTVFFAHRVDQIHFKLYAAADRGGYHIDDLRALSPSEDEVESAARWAMTHGVSEGFAMVLKHLLQALGYGTVARRI